MFGALNGDFSLCSLWLGNFLCLALFRFKLDLLAAHIYHFESKQVEFSVFLAVTACYLIKFISNRGKVRVLEMFLSRQNGKKSAGGKFVKMLDGSS
jgi:hypothetical protein